MERLFPRIYKRLAAAGYTAEAAGLVLRDARRGDRAALVVVRALTGLHRMGVHEFCELLSLSEVAR